jgi:hypothetical protein
MFSLKRAASVLLRINLLSCVLPYVMRTDYMFYYFAPLVSFWFLVVYLTLSIGQQGNSNPIFLLLKLMMCDVGSTDYRLLQDTWPAGIFLPSSKFLLWHLLVYRRMAIPRLP